MNSIEAPNPERMTAFDFAHPDIDSLFQQPANAEELLSSIG